MRLQKHKKQLRNIAIGAGVGLAIGLLFDIFIKVPNDNVKGGLAFNFMFLGAALVITYHFITTIPFLIKFSRLPLIGKIAFAGTLFVTLLFCFPVFHTLFLVYKINTTNSSL